VRRGAGVSPHEWCGNTGWLPGYPALIRAVAATGLDLPTAGLAVSIVFALLTLVLIDVAFVREEPWRIRLAVLALAAVFPGFVYFHAIFPMSLVAFLEMLTVRQLARQRWLSAGLAAGGLAFSYMTGVFGALPSAVAAWLGSPTATRRERLRAVGASAGLCVAGFGAVPFLHWWTTGAWNALFLAQHKYRHRIWLLLTTLRRVFRRMARAEWGDARMIQGAQSLLVAVIVLVLRHWRRSSTLDRVALAWTLVFWLGPLALGAQVSLYRSEGLVLPVVLVTRRLPIAVQAILVALAAVVGFGLARLFIQGRVV
jgi:hypothetical protein